MTFKHDEQIYIFNYMRTFHKNMPEFKYCFEVLVLLKISNKKKNIKNKLIKDKHILHTKKIRCPT